MTDHQYERPFDPNSNDSLAKLARLITPGSVVLDLGSGPGILARYLRDEKSCVVDGADRNVLTVEANHDRFRTMLCLDFDAVDLAAVFPAQAYDFVICADVLEHLHDPARLVRQLPALLGPNGRLLLSVPNVGHMGLLTELIGGEFRYRLEGLLDETHLRFFTRASLLRFLTEAGFGVVQLDTVEQALPETEFDVNRFLALPGDVRTALSTKVDAKTYQFIVEAVPQNVPDTANPTRNALRHPVDIIVPVYNALDDLKTCLGSIFSAWPVRTCEILVIDDASPDPDVAPYLAELEAAGRITLLTNEVNRGFVATVNRGMQLHPDRDIVLLNSDTEVAGDWLDRLSHAAYLSPNTATVTPFSNNAEICSYPAYCVNNPLPEGWTTATLDGVFRDVNHRQTVEIPTAVGFCMYIRRNALDDVGLFDADTFGRGYGEENDFCMRARQRGWHHVLAADVFVRHFGGASFGDEKQRRLEQAALLLRKRHPAYDGLVGDHILEDPERRFRVAVDLARLASSAKPRLLFVTHGLGGGTEKHIAELSAFLEPDAEIIVLRQASAARVSLTWSRSDVSAELWFTLNEDYESLVRLLRALQIGRIHYHHLLGLPQIVSDFPRSLGVPFDVTIHDFYTVCPQVNFVDYTGGFCEQPDEAGCDRCLTLKPARGADDGIRAWRDETAWWFDAAERVFVPSADAAARIRRYHPEAPIIEVPHSDLTSPAPDPIPAANRWVEGEAFRVVIVGALSDVKGREIVRQCAIDAASRGLPLEFHVIGAVAGALPQLPHFPVTVHGVYKDEDLPDYFARLKPHVAWFPAQWPETFNYVLSACMNAGLPVIAPDIGAFPERVQGRSWSWIRPWNVTAKSANDFFLEIAAQNFTPSLSPVPPQGNFRPSAHFSYKTDYLTVAPPATSVALQNLTGLLPPEAFIRPVRSHSPLWTTGNILRDQLVVLKEESASLLGGIVERDDQLKQLQNSAGGLREKVGALEGGIAERDTELMRLHQDNAWLKDRIGTLAGGIAERDDQLMRLHQEEADLRTKIGALDGGIAERDEQLMRLHQEGADLRTKIGALDGGIVERDEQLMRLYSDAAALRETLSALENGIVERDNIISVRDVELDALRSEIVSLKGNIVEVTARHEQFIAALRASTSWRLTKPIRFAKRLVDRILSKAGSDDPIPANHSDAISGPFTDEYQTESTPTPEITPVPQPAFALPELKRLRINTSRDEEPKVSVIIPVYNNLNYTIACLDSIELALPDASFEILIVDDASSDATFAELSVRDDIRYLRNDHNLGFIQSCNRGAGAARGEFLFFLNNDTVVLPGWLDLLVATFRNILDAGLVGSKLIYPDGRLQEAGGIIWEDASGWNWGRLADPMDPGYNYLRDADYCSGAAIMIRRSLFDDIGGFDQRFIPAYYEDTDLAFTVRQRGLRVLYQPLSQVIHYEGITSGTDLSNGAKAHQVTNQVKFAEKWQHVLASHGPNGLDTMNALNRRSIGRILILDPCTPTPDQDAGSVLMFNLMRIFLALGYRVTFAPEDNFLHFGKYTEALQAIGVECLYTPYVSSVDQLLAERGAEFDVVMLVRAPHAKRHFDLVRERCPQASVIFNTIDLHYLREERLAHLSGDPVIRGQAEETKRIELDLVRKSDVTIVLSQMEHEILAVEVPDAPMIIIPLICDVPGRRRPFEQRDGLVFVGGFRHHPNIDAVLWFADAVWPLVRQALPEAKLSVVGSSMPPEIAGLTVEGIEILGFVADIEPILDQSLINIAPLRYGAGLKGKLASSMANGLPSVATSIAVEGMGLATEEGILVGDSPEEFAAQIARLYRDQVLWQSLSDTGLAFVEREFSLRANALRVEKMLMDLVCPVAGEKLERAVDGGLEEVSMETLN